MNIILAAGTIIYYLVTIGVSSEHIFNKTYSQDNDTLFELDNSCKRTCLNGVPMTCRYHFMVEWYQTLSKACYSCPDVWEDCFRPDCVVGDATRRTILTINRMVPGPSIEVCLGDRVIIEVENLLMAETTSIHWHGHHQRNSPYMDGVPFVTQCPILPGTTFKYDFKVLNAGTHFWHSHSGMQRGDGAFGPFIVRVPEESNPHQELYDYDLSEHTISLLDWDKDIGLNMFVSHYHSIGDNKPANLLINGLGLRSFKNASSSPIATFNVKQGFRYRFRLINAGFLNCPVEMSVDNHTLTVISSDGGDFEALEVDSLVSYAGERFDFIIDANQSKSVYWIKFRGLMDCDERFTKAHQIALLQYDGIEDDIFPDGPLPTYETSGKEGLQLNPINKGTENNETLSMPHLHSLDPWDTSLKPEADNKFYIYYDFYKINNPHYHKFPQYGFNNVTDRKSKVLTPQLNRISMKLPPMPLLQYRDEFDDTMFCNENTLKGKNCTEDFCQCTHLIPVKLNSIVELILIDTGFAYDANHPFHLHGHSFRVVGMERIGKNVTVEKIKELDKQNKLKRNLDDPPVKDTVTVPDGGYTIVRFNASNPGYWIFHCHIEFHVEVGMSLIFKFGENDEMPPVPEDFLQCAASMNLYSSHKSIGVNNKISSTYFWSLQVFLFFILKNVIH